MDFKWENFQWLLEELIRVGMKMGIALLIIFAGFWLGSKLKNIIRNRMVARSVDPSIREFIIPILDVVFKILVILTAINTVGIQITSFAAIMAGMAAGVGLSLQGSLSNFAGGLLIILFKPFKVGDSIEALGNAGTVESISILYTTIVTDARQVVILPNSALLNNPVKNSSVKSVRKVQFYIGISYEESFVRVQELLLNALKSEPKILTDHPIQVEIMEFTEKFVKVVIRGYVKQGDSDEVFFNLTRKTKIILEENNVNLKALNNEGDSAKTEKDEEEN
jgi:small conductance mechanosensitive channel